MQVAKKPGPPGAPEWGHRRLSGRSGLWALSGWGWRGRDGWVPGLRAGQAAGSLLPGELSDLLSPPHFRAAGEGDGAASLSSLLPATCLAAGVAVPSAEPERRLTTYEDLLLGRNEGVGAPGISGEVDIASPAFWILG